MAAPKGHPKYGGGRAVGTPNKITTDLRETIIRAFDKVGGEAYLVKIAHKNPQVFCALLARILPVNVSTTPPGVESPTAKIAETLELLRNKLGPAQITYERRHETTQN